MSQDSDDDYKPVIEDLACQNRGPFGQYAFVHQECLQKYLAGLKRNKKQLVLEDQIEEFDIAKVLKEHEINTIGMCDECGQEISPESKMYCRLWVVNLSDYNAYLSKRSQDVLSPQEARELDSRTNVQLASERAEDNNFHFEVWQDSLSGLDDLVNSWINGSLETDKFLLQHADLFACCKQILALAQKDLKAQLTDYRDQYDRHYKLHTSPKRLLPIYRVKLKWFG